MTGKQAVYDFVHELLTLILHGQNRSRR